MSKFICIMIFKNKEKVMSERKELVNELLIVFILLSVITVSSYIVVETLTSEKATTYLQSITHLI